jgi:hypothetical protein
MHFSKFNFEEGIVLEGKEPFSKAENSKYVTGARVSNSGFYLTQKFKLSSLATPKTPK